MAADPEPADWKAVGRAVYLRRVELGMERQQDLAEQAGVHLNTIGRIERGVPSTRKNPTWPKIEAALQWPVGYISKLAGDSLELPIPEGAVDGIRQAVRAMPDFRIRSPASHWSSHSPTVISFTSDSPVRNFRFTSSESGIGWPSATTLTSMSAICRCPSASPSSAMSSRVRTFVSSAVAAVPVLKPERRRVRRLPSSPAGISCRHPHVP